MTTLLADFKILRRGRFSGGDPWPAMDERVPSRLAFALTPRPKESAPTRFSGAHKEIAIFVPYKRCKQESFNVDRETFTLYKPSRINIFYYLSPADTGVVTY